MLDQLASALTVILRSYGDRAMPYIDGIMPQLAQLLDAQRSVQERRIGVCIMDDILEHSAAGAWQPTSWNIIHDGFLIVVDCLCHLL